jgi:hypothetical protein
MGVYKSSVGPEYLISTEIDVFEPICKAWLGREDSNRVF